MSQASPADPASLGIDVANATFDAALFIHGRLLHRNFAMTSQGFDALHTCLQQAGSGAGSGAGACLPGSDWRVWVALALSLYEAGYVVSSVTPARSAADATSRLARTKTDKADAALIAHFCRTQHPVPWTPPPAEGRELPARVRRVEMLQEMAQQEVNRLHSGLHSPAVRAWMEATLAFLRQEVDAMQRLVQEQLEQSADLPHKQRLLCSIPGIGQWTAAILFCQLVWMNEVVAKPWKFARVE